jgi:molecular chaperone DnaJ
MGETYYELLGVPENATTDEIERAYREKLKESHPDVSDSDDASERTKRLIEAKETLTDETKRKRYDRQGHGTYVGSTAEPTTSGPTKGEGGKATQATGKTTTGRRQNQRTTRDTYSTQTRTTRSQGAASTNAENVGSGAAWAQTSNRDAQANTHKQPDSSWRVWSSDRAYAVERGVDVLRFGGIFKDQDALVLLATTLLVYPVLLFGALNPTFPLAINLFVAACVIFVIAFLQSIPEVGMVVFGSWTLLLPPVLFAGFGLNLFSLQSVLALTAVIFPLGLSALTRVAIRPITAG